MTTPLHTKALQARKDELLRYREDRKIKDVIKRREFIEKIESTLNIKIDECVSKTTWGALAWISRDGIGITYNGSGRDLCVFSIHGERLNPTQPFNSMSDLGYILESLGYDPDTEEYKAKRNEKEESELEPESNKLNLKRVFGYLLLILIGIGVLFLSVL